MIFFLESTQKNLIKITLIISSLLTINYLKVNPDSNTFNTQLAIDSIKDNPNTVAKDPRPCRIILVHGTFARTAPWHQLNSDFCQAVKTWATEQKCNITIESFKWTGALSSLKRMEAAAEMAKYLLPILQAPTENIILIAHSHGANVVFLATQFLALQNMHDLELRQEKLWQFMNKSLAQEAKFKHLLKVNTIRSMLDPFDPTPQSMFDFELSAEQESLLKNQIVKEVVNLTPVARSEVVTPELNPIAKIFALGAPIDANVYWPADKIVNQVYSCYSEGDKIQIYSAQFKRRFADFVDFKPKTCKVVDCKVTFNSSSSFKAIEHPKHLQLNTAIIGRWLLELPELLTTPNSCFVHKNNCCHTWVHFFKDQARPALKKA